MRKPIAPPIDMITTARPKVRRFFSSTKLVAVANGFDRSRGFSPVSRGDSSRPSLVFSEGVVGGGGGSEAATGGAAKSLGSNGLFELRLRCFFVFTFLIVICAR